MVGLLQLTQTFSRHECNRCPHTFTRRFSETPDFFCAIGYRPGVPLERSGLKSECSNTLSIPLYLSGSNCEWQQKFRDSENRLTGSNKRMITLKRRYGGTHGR